MSRNLIHNMFFNVLKRKKNKKKQFSSLFTNFGRGHALKEMIPSQCINPGTVLFATGSIGSYFL